MLLLVTALCVLLQIESVRREHVLGRAVTKTLASLGFFAYALAVGVPGTAGGGLWMTAFGLSVLGDVLLLPKDKRALGAGIVAFLGAHAAFVAGFYGLGLSVPALGALAAVHTALGIAAWRAFAAGTGALKPLAAVYVVVVSAMCATGIACAVATGRVNLGIAAVMFFVSDGAVARQRFVVDDVRNRMVGLPLYYAAQLLFAAEVAR